MLTGWDGKDLAAFDGAVGSTQSFTLLQIRFVTVIELWKSVSGE
jgi:hypothetical protein